MNKEVQDIGRGWLIAVLITLALASLTFAQTAVADGTEKKRRDLIDDIEDVLDDPDIYDRWFCVTYPYACTDEEILEAFEESEDEMRKLEKLGVVEIHQMSDTELWVIYEFNGKPFILFYTFELRRKKIRSSLF